MADAAISVAMTQEEAFCRLELELFIVALPCNEVMRDFYHERRRESRGVTFWGFLSFLS